MTDLGPLWSKVLEETSTCARLLHGPDHWARVERNGLYLARRCGGDELVVRLFAIFHDCMRLTEGVDPAHGKRASEYIRTIAADLAFTTQQQLDTLTAACDDHTLVRHSDDHTIGACWDADRLDIGRANMIPDPAFLNCDAAKEIARTKSFALLDEVELRPVVQ